MICPQGYTYRGRVIGFSMDNDSRMYTFGEILTLAKGDVLSVTVRKVDLNRDGGPHAITEAPLDVDNVELRYSRGLWAGKISLGLGYNDPATPAQGSSGAHGFALWQQGY